MNALVRAPRPLVALAAVACLLGSGCGDDGKSAPGPYDSEFQGVWSISSWTENGDSCDAEGESVLESKEEKLMLVQACTLSFGISVDFLHALQCTDEADCDEKRCTADELNLSGYTFAEGGDDGGWMGEATFASGAGGETCDAEVNLFTLSRDGDDLVLRSETFEVAGVPKDAEGFCDTDAARAMASSQPCVKLEVLRLTQQ